MTSTSAASRYGLAIAAPVVALLSRMALSPLLGDDAPLLLFVFAVAAVAWHGGAGPGLVTTGLSIALADWFFIAPKGSLAITGQADVLRLVVFAVAGALFSWMGQVARQAALTRNEAEARLREREALLATLTEHARVGMVMLTAERRYAFANTTYAEVLGLASADIVGRSVADVLDPVYGTQIRPQLDRAFGGERVAHDLMLPPRQAGEGERSFAISYEPVSTAHGPCVIMMVVDISERRRAEQAVRRSEERYRSLFDGSLDAIFSLGADGRFVSANPAALQLAGATLEQVQAMHFLDLCAPDQRDAASQAFRAAFCRECLTLETVLIGADGTQRELFISGAPAIVDGEVVGVSCIGRDVTERRTAERALRDSEERLRALGDNLPDSAVYQFTVVPGHGPRYLYVSAGIEVLNGVRVEDVLRDAGTLLRQFAPHDLQRMVEAQRRSAGDLSDFVFEAPMQHPDGAQRWMLLRSRPRRLPDGQVVWDGVRTDITERKRRERNLAFLAELQHVFAPLTSAADIMRSASERIVQHLGLRNCVLAEIDEAAQLVHILHDQHAPGLASSVGVRALADWRNEAERRELVAGKTVVTEDVRAGPGPPGELQRLEARGVRSRVSAPYVTNGQWKFVLVASRGEPYAWPREDVELLTDLAARICVRVQRARAEEQLRESEAGERARRGELEAVMAALPTAVFIAHDPRCERITANPAGRALLRVAQGRNPSAGAPEAERPDYQVWSHGRRLAPQDLPMQRAAATGQAVLDTETEIVFPSGESRHILGSALPLFDDSGKVRGCVGTFIDISERERRQRNLAFLAEMQTKFASLTNAADITRVASERLAQHLGLKRCMLVEIDEPASQARVIHDQHAMDAPGMAGVYPLTDFRNEAERRELAAGKTLVNNDVRSESRARHERQRLESRGIRSLVTAPYVADGRWKFMLSAQRGEPYAWPREDVELLTDLAARICVRVERARAEEELVASRQRFAGIVESAMDAIVSVDAHQRIVLFNAAAERMFGCPAAQAIGGPLDRFVPLRFRAAHRGYVERFGGSGTTNRAMGRLGAPLAGLRADGEEFPIEASISKVEAAGEQLFTVILRDVTERRQAEALARKHDEALRNAEQVALASKYKSEFLANMSHELRTPLNSLLILSRLLADNRERNLTPKQVEFAQVMHQSGSDLLHLINEILDLSRIEAGQVEVYVESVALAALGKKIEGQFRPVAQSKPIEFSVSVDPALPATIRSDAGRVEQVLKNLLANAFKFTAAGGSVKLAIQRVGEGWPRPHAGLDAADGVVAFAVSDSGIGIAPDKQQLIFEAFQQADGSTSRKYGGTGLGLSISREIAALLGGAITLASEPGVGSTFTLYLPITYPGSAAAARSAPTGRQAEPARAADAASAASFAVDDDEASIGAGDDVLLLVENDANFARLLLDIAHGHGFKGLIASSASAALQLARQHHPTAITLSVTLPDMDGWQLLQYIGDDLSVRHIPVHIVSGEDERPRGLRQGAVSYLQKPVTEAALGALFDRIRSRKSRALSQLLLIEDDPAMQVQLQRSIGAGAAIEATLVASAEQGLHELRSRRYDCVVLDLRLPGMTGFEFLEAVRDQLAIDDLPIVVYTGQDLSAPQQARLRQLAESVLIKDAGSFDRLLDEVVHYLHCPLEALPPPARQAVERLHGGAETLAGSKVLVVDDDMRNVYALLSILEGAGIEVLHADNGLRCLEVLQSVPDIQAVLMDIMMPGMDGYEATRRIRRMPGRQTLPVIALTARAMKGDREKCLEAGASDYLTKPVDGAALLARLGLWIRR